MDVADHSQLCELGAVVAGLHDPFQAGPLDSNLAVRTDSNSSAALAVAPGA